MYSLSAKSSRSKTSRVSSGGHEEIIDALETACRPRFDCSSSSGVRRTNGHRGRPTRDRERLFTVDWSYTDQVNNANKNANKGEKVLINYFRKK